MNKIKLMLGFFTLFSVIAINAGASRLIEVGQLASSGNQDAIEKWFNSPFNKPELGLALNAASRKGHLEMVVFLVSKGVDKTDRQMALEQACKNKHKDVAQFLINQGSVNGDIPLCKNINLNLAEPSTTEQEPVKFSTFYAAVKNGDASLVTKLSKRVALGTFGDDGMTALQKAAQLENLELVKILVKNGAPLDQKDGMGNTALHIACRKGNLAIIEFLINEGANYKLVNNYGKRPHDNYSVSTANCSELELLEKILELTEEKEKKQPSTTLLSTVDGPRSFLGGLKKRIELLKKEDQEK